MRRLEVLQEVVFVPLCVLPRAAYSVNGRLPLAFASFLSHLILNCDPISSFLSRVATIPGLHQDHPPAPTALLNQGNVSSTSIRTRGKTSGSSSPPGSDPYSTSSGIGSSAILSLALCVRTDATLLNLSKTPFACTLFPLGCSLHSSKKGSFILV